MGIELPWRLGGVACSGLEAQARGLQTMTRGFVTASWETYSQETERDGPDELEDGHLSRCHVAKQDQGTR